MYCYAGTYQTYNLALPYLSTGFAEAAPIVNKSSSVGPSNPLYTAHAVVKPPSSTSAGVNSTRATENMSNIDIMSCVQFWLLQKHACKDTY